MGWLGRWLGAWAGRWLGHEPERQQQERTVPFIRYGRILSPATDRLFGVQQGSSQLCQISAGAVILGRTETDDYVRMRVPDTFCPFLPQPRYPLDLGASDIAEPDRWVVSGQPDTSSNWLIAEQTDQIQLAYSCFSGDFEVEVVSDYVSKTGSCTGDISVKTWDGVALMFELGGKTFGIGVTWSHHFGETEVPWGGSQGRSYLWFVAQRTNKIAYGELMIPNSQTNVRYRVQRSGSNIRFGMLSSSGSWVYSSWQSAGNGEIVFRWEGVRVLVGGPDA